VDATLGVQMPVDQAVTRLIAVADPNRLALLRALTSGPTCVCNLPIPVQLCTR
jgi:hypothetical protein